LALFPGLPAPPSFFFSLPTKPSPHTLTFPSLAHHHQASAFPPPAAVRINLRMVAVLTDLATASAGSPTAAVDAVGLLDAAAPALANEAVARGGATSVGPVSAWCAAAAAVRRGLVGLSLGRVGAGLTPAATDAEMDAAVAAACPPTPPPLLRLVGDELGEGGGDGVATLAAAAAAAAAAALPMTQAGGGGGPPAPKLLFYGADGPDTPARRRAAVRAQLETGERAPLPAGLSRTARSLLPLAAGVLGEPALAILTQLRDQQLAVATAEAAVSASRHLHHHPPGPPALPPRRRFGACGALGGPGGAGPAPPTGLSPDAGGGAASGGGPSPSPGGGSTQPSSAARPAPLVAGAAAAGATAAGRTLHWTPTPSATPAPPPPYPDRGGGGGAGLILPGVDAATAALLNAALGVLGGGGGGGHPPPATTITYTRNGAPRRKNRRWLAEEAAALMTLVSEHGPGNWSLMAREAGRRARTEVHNRQAWAGLASRSQMDLKDKWRGIVRKYPDLADQQWRGESLEPSSSPGGEGEAEAGVEEDA
jgi:hypothetical protein